MNIDNIYSDYFEHLIQGDQSYCIAVVNNLLMAETDIKSIFINLFQRSLYQVGELWERNQVSVATEHLATAITEGLMTLVYPKIFSQEHIQRTAIVSCTPNEYHQVGGRMVADIFELNRWNGYFLGANTPTQGLLSMIQEKQPDVLALSMSIYFSVSSLLSTIDEVRSAYLSLPILIGGQAFRWGGSDIADKYPGVELVNSLDELEVMINQWQ